MQLLAIPALLAYLAYVFTSAQSNKELALAQIHKREEALQNYFEYMTNLLIGQEYAHRKPFEGASRLIRARTLTTLEMLDGKQKGHLLRFLIEAGLLDRKKPYLDMARANLEGVVLEPGLYSDFSLDHADLDNSVLPWCSFRNVSLDGTTMMRADLEESDFASGSLVYINLRQSDLYGANLADTKMYKADLRDANLEKASMAGAVLSRANLRGANLSRVQAKKADMSSADLSFTILREADLRESNITKGQLRQVKSFRAAKLPRSARGKGIR